MPNLNVVLGEEIRRLARKEIKAQAGPRKDSSGRQRSDIAALKKRCSELERRLKALEKGRGGQAASKSTAENDDEGTGRRPRFSPGWVKKHRDKLGLSAADYGKLVGVSGLTIYNWEKGGSSPRAKQLAAWNEIRTLGKREARRQLAELSDDADSAEDAAASE